MHVRSDIFYFGFSVKIGNYSYIMTLHLDDDVLWANIYGISLTVELEIKLQHSGNRLEF